MIGAQPELPAGAVDRRAGAQYDLPAQDLEETLRSIAKAAGREILFAPETVNVFRAPSLKGRFTFKEALRTALADSGPSTEIGRARC